MASNRPDPNDFRRRFAAGEQLIGTFIKTPTSHAIEILGDVGYDFVVIDEEHAPFDRVSIDIGILAAKASGTAGIVRVAAPTASNILSVLDCGATGVLVPHVASVEKAKEIVAACRYRGGRRGFSASPRAGRYGGFSMAEHIANADKTVTVIAMIEDPEALDHIDAIAAVEGLDGFFIGRGDLTVAFGAADANAPEVRNAVERITAAAKKVKKPVCVMVGGVAEAKPFKELGASAFIVSTDQGFLRRAATQALTDMASLKT
jgi:staphyloferrin B biosynthesis citrate synthase